MRVGEFKQFQATVIADDPYCVVLRPPDRDSYDLAVDAFRKAEGMLKAWRRGPVEPRDFFVGPRPVKPPAENETVRTDCPAFAGLHEADGRRIRSAKLTASTRTSASSEGPSSRMGSRPAPTVAGT